MSIWRRTRRAGLSLSPRPTAICARSPKNTGSIYEYKIEITEGEFAGAKWIGNINVTNTSAAAQRIGQGQLSALALAQGQDPLLVNDTEQYENIPFMADVGVESYTANNGQERERNVVLQFVHGGNVDTVPRAKPAAKPAANDNKPPQTTAANSNNQPVQRVASETSSAPAGGAKRMPWQK
jgi:hypothetical protein